MDRANGGVAGGDRCPASIAVRRQIRCAGKWWRDGWVSDGGRMVDGEPSWGIEPHSRRFPARLPDAIGRIRPLQEDTPAVTKLSRNFNHAHRSAGRKRSW